MAPQETENRKKVQRFIGDARVLSEKCNRDVENKFYFNYQYYLDEINRIIAEVKQMQPEIFEGMDLVKPPWNPSLVDGSVHGCEVGKLHEISAVTDKLLNRLGQLYREEIQPVTVLERIFSRFHQFVRQMRSRHDSRETISVKDEYDVQDLVHALLKLSFDDIRPEEWTPSYAGSSSRMDFLLKNEQLVIEVKKTRDKLGGKEIGEQLIVDIAKYKEHPDCKTLICFVYDPEALVSNPRGLENDLGKLSNDRLSVRVYIEPK